MDAGDAVVNLAEEPEQNRPESGTLLAPWPVRVLADSPTCTIDLPPSPPHPEEKQGQDHDPEFADTSAPLFVMYHRMTEDEDNQLADRWQKDAKGIIIFVSPQFTLHATFFTPLRV
jgi:hypothetical protein